jgi:hypothetical protein
MNPRKGNECLTSTQATAETRKSCCNGKCPLLQREVSRYSYTATYNCTVTEQLALGKLFAY